VSLNIATLLAGRCLVLLAILSGGCKPDGPSLVRVHGAATHNGEPLAQIGINFLPEQGRPSRGNTDAQGRFTMYFDAGREGVVAGKCRVTISYEPKTPAEEEALRTGNLSLSGDLQAVLKKYGHAASPLIVELSHDELEFVLALD